MWWKKGSPEIWWEELEERQQRKRWSSTCTANRESSTQLKLSTAHTPQEKKEKNSFQQSAKTKHKPSKLVTVYDVEKNAKALKQDT